MKAKLSEYINTLSGPMGKEHYASKCPNEPGYVLIKHKPGPHNRPGKRRDRWTMPENRAAVISAFQSNPQRASAEYLDPDKRAQWQQEYDTWLKKEHKRGRQGNRLNGKSVRYLWNYIRIRCTEQSDTLSSQSTQQQGNTLSAVVPCIISVAAL